MVHPKRICERDMNESHLYSGFKYASYLPSIRVQRFIQRRILHGLLHQNGNASLLSIGAAFGDELNELLAGVENEDLKVYAIDLAYVNEEIYEQPFAIKLGKRFQWLQIDLLEAESIDGFGKFAVTQCGFTLHDIQPNDKKRAFMVLANSVREGGWIILSDIFITNPAAEDFNSPSYKAEVDSIYSFFLGEASDAHAKGILDERGLAALIGDANYPGLRRSLADALKGSRDFFETLTQTQQRLTSAGLIVQQVISNTVNPKLAVVLARRPNTLPL
jgi:hypothetical protein